MTTSTAARAVTTIDWREPARRREAFLRFYDLHLRYRSHPGAVYYALPALAEAHGWDGEQRAWCAFLNANTQNPVTTALLMQAGDRPGKSDDVIDFWRRHYHALAWDTDRRHHKARFGQAVTNYRHLTRGGQVRYWAPGARDWDVAWARARDVYSMGRLSAWSYLEYLRILDVADLPDAPTLLLRDRDGSRSHRNGLCLVLGLDDYMWWKQNPGFDGRYAPDLLTQLEIEGERLLAAALARNPAAGNLTLESALCTYKSWHRPRRRYAGVYNDLLHDRITTAERAWGHRFGVLWDARAAALPDWMRLERMPGDYGATPTKQNHYLETGHPVVMGHVWADMWSRYDATVAERGWLRGAQ